MQALDKMTDAQLVQAYTQGNNTAFDTLLTRYQAQVYNYIMASVKDATMADDIFQETFVKVITTLKQNRYTENGKFGAWLLRIARNLIIDHFRQEKSENAVSTDDENFSILNRKELSDATIEDIMVDAQICTDVRRLIMQLPHNQRCVLVMRYYKNLSFKEIAEKLNISINTALGRMRYAILNMRRMASERKIELSRV